MVRATLRGSLDASSIRRVIRRRLPEIRACYEAALGRAAVKGAVRLHLVVDGWGRVAQVDVARNDTGDAALGRCVVGHARTWIFPEVIPTDSISDVTYPLILAPQP